MALVRLEIDMTPQAIDAKRYSIYLAVGNRRIEIADFASVATCKFYVRNAYKRFQIKDPEFEPELYKLTAPWFEV